MSALALAGWLWFAFANVGTREVLGSGAWLTLTPTGWVCFCLLLGLVVSLVVVTSTWHVERGLMIAACLLLVLALPAFFWNTAILIVVFVGAAALAASALWNTVRRSRDLRIAVALCLFLLLVSGGALAMHAVVAGFDGLFPGWAPSAEYTRQPAPSGDWVAVTQSDAVSTYVTLERDVTGLVRIRRSVYASDMGRPLVRWLGPNVLQVGNMRVRI